MTQDWFTETGNFFGERYLRMYEGLLTSNRTKKEIGFVLSILQTSKEGRALDVPCGHGRHAIELAKHGYDVTGYELNKHFLQVAQDNAAKERVTVTWLPGDMRELHFEEEFDVALNLFTAMGYFGHDSDDQKFIDAVYSSLKPNGEFIIDYINSYRVLRQLRSQNWERLSDGSYVLHERQFDVVTGTMHDTRTHLDTDDTYTVKTSVRFYTPAELIKMLKQSGFSIIDTYGDFTGAPLTMDSNRLIIHAKKD